MSRIRLALMAASTLLLMTACASSPGSATSTTSAAAVPPPTTSAPASAPAAATAAATAAAAIGLSGTWSGQYSGAYQGTFTLHWRQSSSRLSGAITLSVPADTLSIHGTVDGGVIRFGSVGSMAVTYSGTVSGNSMSGSYQVHDGTVASSGSWSASRAS